MEKKSPQKFAYMAFAARDSHNSIDVLYNIKIFLGMKK